MVIGWTLDGATGEKAPQKGPVSPHPSCLFGPLSIAR